MRAMFAAVAAMVALSACSTQAGDTAPQQSEAVAEIAAASGLRIVPLTVTHAGTRHAFRVEVAETPEQQARGLMFRTALAPDEGMIFPMNPPRGASFWMRNTVIPLDIVFVGTDGRILNIGQGVPYNETPVTSAGPVKAVLELNGGRAAQLGIGPGDLVEW